MKISIFFSFIFSILTLTSLPAQDCSNDVTPPVVECRADTSFFIDIGGSTALQPSDIYTKLEDDCGINFNSLFLNATNFSGQVTFPTRVSVQDLSGNESSCTTLVTANARPWRIELISGTEFEQGEENVLLYRAFDVLSNTTLPNALSLILFQGTQSFADQIPPDTYSFPIPATLPVGEYDLAIVNYQGNFELRSETVTFTIVDPDADDDDIIDDEDNCPLDANPDQSDMDCDQVGDVCDICPGGDDSIDNNGNGISDCSEILAYNEYTMDWLSSKNRIAVCHKGKTKAIKFDALADHFGHGDVIGPCTSCAENRSLPAATSVDLLVYPSPAFDQFTIELDEKKSWKQMDIYNSSGQKVYSNSLSENIAKIQLTKAEIGGLAGIYLVRIEGPELTMTKQFMLLK